MNKDSEFLRIADQFIEENKDFLMQIGSERRCRDRVLIGCEFSGRVRDAFRARGYDAVSCDLIPSETPGPHIQDDILRHLRDGWKKAIIFPPCTHLAVSGARWFKDKRKEQEEALEFVRKLLDAPIPMIALENPVSVIATKIRKPDQIIQPWMFGEEYQKTTCLWLKNLPKLVPTKIVGRGEFFVKSGSNGKDYKYPKWMMDDMKNREKNRSRTFRGIANAMADQWGPL